MSDILGRLGRDAGEQPDAPPRRWPRSAHGGFRGDAALDGGAARVAELAAQNRLLASLPLDERDAIYPRLTRRTFEAGREVHRRGAPVRELVFPLRGAVALVNEGRDGDSLAVVITGSDGVVGVSSLIGLASAPWREVVQVAGDALVLPVDDFDLARFPVLARRMMAYVGVILVAEAQTAACARFHRLDHRAARWLLQLTDLCDGDALPITHEALASMLGANRSSVTVALNALQQAGTLRLGRREIVVCGSGALREMSCDCYGRVQQALQRAEQQLRLSSTQLTGYTRS